MKGVRLCKAPPFASEVNNLARVKMKNPPSIGILKEYLDYNKDTGLFTWNKSKGRAKAGSVAGTPHSHGYVNIMVSGHMFYAHRLAWLYHYGNIPDVGIDHINMIKNDNRIQNLRLATQSQNQGNITKRVDNKSGYKGVSWSKGCKKWLAQITLNGKAFNLGVYETKEKAYAAYCEAAVKNRGEFARV
jgi:hypothetical protein